ncbi:MAG: hypothetical protein ACLFV0_03140 [Nitriliruptoraceae bacterium]
MTSQIPLGPPILGLALGADTVIEQGWLVRELSIPDGLDGPPGILQGGFAAGLLASVARAADPYGAPLTGIEARLHAPTPLARGVQARLRAADGPARTEVEVRDGAQLLVSGVVELAGHEPPPTGLDLLELARTPLPEPVPQQEYPTCVVCGPQPRHPVGQRLHPRFGPAGTIVQPWIPSQELGTGGTVDELLVAAVLDCPTVWAAIAELRDAGYLGALLAGFRVVHHREVPVDEPVRVVARLDGLDGRKVRARSAVVDEDGVVYAVASALHVAVTALPDPPA